MLFMKGRSVFPFLKCSEEGFLKPFQIIAQTPQKYSLFGKVHTFKIFFGQSLKMPRGKLYIQPLAVTRFHKNFWAVCSFFKLTEKPQFSQLRSRKWFFGTPQIGHL